MLKSPIFLDSVFKERIWGGTELRDKFGYQIPSKFTGEYWAISAHPNGYSVVRDGKYKGKTLKEIWEEDPDLFAHFPSDRFPLLTKIIDANQDLSIQVHPGDKYAKVHENGELGKAECWYIIDCKEGSEMIYGHNAITKEDLRLMINNGKWDQLLRKVPIKPGDFFYIPSGTIHGLCEGTLVLETQQSSDTTYRVYDYDRLNNEGNKRDLHIEKALDVITVPHHDLLDKYTITEEKNAKLITYIENEFFTIYKWTINGRKHFTHLHPFLLVSIIEGSGQIITDDGTFHIEKSDHLIIPAKLNDFSIEGTVECLVSTPQQ